MQSAFLGPEKASELEPKEEGPEAAFAASHLYWRKLKRAGIRRANRVCLSLDDWQAAIIRAELVRKDSVHVTVNLG